MAETGNTFKKAPKRKGDKGRRVAVSAETRAAYEAIIKERQEREETYARHLPSDPPKRG